MKIAVIGSHSTGKTTLCNMFVKKHPEYFLIPEIARVFGIEKIKEKTIRTQYEMMDTQSCIESYHENFISDRSILDFGIYSMNTKFIQRCLILMEKRYNYVFYIPIRFKLTDDGFRNTDYIYQHTIDELFIKYMPMDIIKIKSISTIDRIKEIENYIYH